MSGGYWPYELTLPRPGGAPVIMRGLRRRDRAEWEALRRDNEDWITPWETASPVPSRKLGYAAMLRHYETEAAAGTMQPFVLQWGGRLVGQMTLSGIVWGAQRSGAAGYWIGRRYLGFELAPMGLAALVDHAFSSLGLHRVEVNIRPGNLASVRVVEKLGFRDEGVRRRFLYVQGAWRDHLTFALTAEDLAGRSLFDEWYERAEARLARGSISAT